MLKKVVKPDRSGGILPVCPFGRWIEKAVSRAGSEESFTEYGMSSVDIPWKKVGGGWIRKTDREKQGSHMDGGAEQSLYEDVETGLYYNRFRYYSPSDGCYTQVDPMGLAGGNPTIYGYVGDTN